MRALSRVLAISLCLSFAPKLAHAQQAAADALFDSARAAMDRGDLTTACQQFRASERLDAAVGTELNLADCEEKRGNLASAWELYRTAAEKLGERDERLALARARIQALTPRLPRLTLLLAAGAPETSTVRNGATELGSAGFGVALPMDPGAHELIVVAPGFESRKFVVQLAEAQALTLTLSPGAAHSDSAAASPAAPRPLPTRDDDAHASRGRTLGFGLAGVGVAGLGVGAVAGLLTLGKKSTVNEQCGPDKACTSAGLSAAQAGHTLQVVSNVGWVLGAAALGAGAYFLLSSGKSSRPATTVSLVSEPAGGHLSISRSF
jgi:hypothetical protein